MRNFLALLFLIGSIIAQAPGVIKNQGKIWKDNESQMRILVITKDSKNLQDYFNTNPGQKPFIFTSSIQFDTKHPGFNLQKAFLWQLALCVSSPEINKYFLDVFNKEKENNAPFAKDLTFIEQFVGALKNCEKIDKKVLEIFVNTDSPLLRNYGSFLREIINAQQFKHMDIFLKEESIKRLPDLEKYKIFDWLLEKAGSEADSNEAKQALLLFLTRGGGDNVKDLARKIQMGNKKKELAQILQKSFRPDDIWQANQKAMIDFVINKNIVALNDFFEINSSLKSFIFTKIITLSEEEQKKYNISLQKIYLWQLAVCKAGEAINHYFMTIFKDEQKKKTISIAETDFIDQYVAVLKHCKNIHANTLELFLTPPNPILSNYNVFLRKLVDENLFDYLGFFLDTKQFSSILSVQKEGLFDILVKKIDGNVPGSQEAFLTFAEKILPMLPDNAFRRNILKRQTEELEKIKKAQPQPEPTIPVPHAPAPSAAKAVDEIIEMYGNNIASDTIIKKIATLSGQQVNELSAANKSLLEFFIEKNEAKIAQALLDKGALVSRMVLYNNEPMSLVQYAIILNRDQMLPALLGRDTDIVVMRALEFALDKEVPSNIIAIIINEINRRAIPLGPSIQEKIKKAQPQPKPTIPVPPAPAPSAAKAVDEIIEMYGDNVASDTIIKKIATLSGQQVNEISAENKSLLEFFIEKNEAKIAQALLDKGARVGRMVLYNNEPMNLVQYAITLNRDQVLPALLKRDLRIDETLKFALNKKVPTNILNIVLDEIYSHELPPDPSDAPRINFAKYIQEKNRQNLSKRELIRLINKATESQINQEVQDNESLLQYFLRISGDVEVVEALLDKGASVTRKIFFKEKNIDLVRYAIALDRSLVLSLLLTQAEREINNQDDYVHFIKEALGYTLQMKGNAKTDIINMLSNIIRKKGIALDRNESYDGRTWIQLAQDTRNNSIIRAVNELLPPEITFPNLANKLQETRKKLISLQSYDFGG